jgi:CRISPR/Cas system-associated endonuclease Cas3-HD
MLAALFHDLGKVDATRPHRSQPGKWSAHGHEFSSARLVEKYRDWIESLGANFDIVYFIVKEHMRVKHIHEMRPSKQVTLRQHKYFDLVHQFSDFDDMQTDFSSDMND